MKLTAWYSPLIRAGGLGDNKYLCTEPVISLTLTDGHIHYSLGIDQRTSACDAFKTGHIQISEVMYSRWP